MSNRMKHEESFHINEVTCTAKGTVQWFLDKQNTADGDSHPITHNNKLKLLICGEDGFRNIAADIKNAKKTIDLCCWGFDPGMELVRDKEKTLWPRGETFGDLLISAAERDVTVRLLVWIQPLMSAMSAIYVDLFNPKNMPGWTHDRHFFETGISPDKVSKINAAMVLDEHRKSQQKLQKVSGAIGIKPDSEAAITSKAREIYCNQWFLATLGTGGKLPISVATRLTNPAKIKASLASEVTHPDETELWGMTLAGSHHQKTILIDYEHDNGKHAVGYVMGLNSVTDYWDTVEHEIENTRRERGSGREASEAVQPLSPDQDGPAKSEAAARPDPGFATFKPYRDYACRLEGGGALIAVRKNFESAWIRANFPADHKSRPYLEREQKKARTPSALLRPSKKGNSSVQIVRTQPDEGDKTIKDLYFQATGMAVNLGGYLYLENQYFQYEEWAQRVITDSKAKAELWKNGGCKEGKTREDMPILHIFIVTPVAERSQMVPRTYDTLATLGQHEGMEGQKKLIAKSNEIGRWIKHSQPDVVEHANAISKPTAKLLELNGLSVVSSMLQVSGSCVDLNGHRRMRYREIYIHSKLLLINDSFFTLGSANLNQRSMAGDSELNLGTNDRRLAGALRKKIWLQLSGKMFDGGAAKQKDLASTIDRWLALQTQNRDCKKNHDPMRGFLLPIEDNRSATIRLG